MQRSKTFLLATCTILAVVIAGQNTESVGTRLLWVTVTMPRALLLILTFLTGTAAGLLLGTRFRPRDRAETR